MSETNVAVAERTLRPRKIFCIATWSIIDTKTFLNYHNLLQQ